MACLSTHVRYTGINSNLSEGVLYTKDLNRKLNLSSHVREIIINRNLITSILPAIFPSQHVFLFIKAKAIIPRNKQIYLCFICILICTPPFLDLYINLLLEHLDTTPTADRSPLPPPRAMAHSSKDVLEEGELQDSNELFGVMGMEGQTAGLVEQFVDNLGDPDGTLDEFFDMKKVQTCHEDDTAFLVPADDDDRGAGWTVDNLLELNGFVPSDRERGREERRRKVVKRREQDVSYSKLSK